MGSKIWLSPPHMGGTEEKYIRAAFDANWIAPLGPNVDGFEEDLGRYLGNVHVAALSSGTAAMHLALLMLGVRQGDEVIAPTFTFIGTVNPVSYLGALPVFIDSEPDTWNMDPVLLEEAVADRIRRGRKPKAIIFVDIYGMPANIGAILDVANRYEIPVIEDAAEALGSSYRQRRCGTWGDLAVLSFNGNKIITTSGGGALVSRDPEAARRARYLASQAKAPVLHFEHPETGYNYRLSNVLAGIGRGQMEVLEQRVDAHRAIERRYRELLAGCHGIAFPDEPGPDYFSNRWLTTVLIEPGAGPFTPQGIIGSLAADDIDSRPLMKPMHLQEVFRGCPAYLNGVSERLFHDGVCLPSGSALTEGDLNRIAGRILLSGRK